MKWKRTLIGIVRKAVSTWPNKAYVLYRIMYSTKISIYGKPKVCPQMSAKITCICKTLERVPCPL